MKKLKLSLVLSLIAILVLSFSGCSRRILDFTIVSSKTADFTKGGFTKGKQRNEGEDKIHIIIFIPTGTLDIKNAVDRAIEKTPGCIALLDGVIRTKSFWIPYIYGQASAIVEGTPLIDPAYTQNDQTPPAYSILRFNKEGGISDFKTISEEQFMAIKADMIKKQKNN